MRRPKETPIHELERYLRCRQCSERGYPFKQTHLVVGFEGATIRDPWRWPLEVLSTILSGQGGRLFPETGPDIALDLIDSQAFPRGITSQVYRPAGRPEYAAG